MCSFTIAIRQRDLHRVVTQDAGISVQRRPLRAILHHGLETDRERQKEPLDSAIFRLLFKAVFLGLTEAAQGLPPTFRAP